MRSGPNRRRAGLAVLASGLIIATSLLTVLSDVGGAGDRVAQVSSLSVTRGAAVAPANPKNAEWRTRQVLGLVAPAGASAADPPGRVDVGVALASPAEHGRALARTRAPPAV